MRAVHDKKTTIRIAGCSAVGLSYWSGHPLNGRVWAVDEYQHAHSVRIDMVGMTARRQSTQVSILPTGRGGRRITCHDVGPAVPFSVENDPQLSLYAY